MGAYIGNPSDLQIVAALNSAFGPGASGVVATRAYFGTETPFDGQHSLSRVAWRLNAYPTDATARGRWFGLLDNLNQAATRTIKNTLRNALSNNAIVAVVFAVMPNPQGATDYSAQADTVDQASHLTLLCPPHDYNGPTDPPGYTPPRDPGEPPGKRPRARRKKKTARRGGTTPRATKPAKRRTKRTRARG
jgi:hypothetical protein